ncbi:MAG: hypothetical protein MMC33_000730 [Icmadophila ericetorum]|nr:hypothetical protein [Icmadophila ericetorum]
MSNRPMRGSLVIQTSTPQQTNVIEEKKDSEVTVRSRTSSSSSSTLSIKTPRTARFAEATSVNSPIGPTPAGRNPFHGPRINTTHLAPVSQPSDVGFGYMSQGDREKHTSIEVPLTPRSPMRSALKVPGTPGRFIDPRSPTFKEEKALEEREAKTEVQNAKDIKVKTRVRIAKLFLRGVNFSCSLIVLSMLSTTFTIFNTTKTLPPRNNLPAWALGQQIWPQVTLLVISCVSLAICLVIFYGYYRGGHRRAQKVAVYYTAYACGFFIFSTVMWVLAAAILQTSRSNGNGQDMWGWSCNDNKRRTLFEQEVHYTLVCRLQNWSLICCLIEIIVEVITLFLYGIVFYRVWSKRKLHKSMDLRDRARSDLYLAQLRSQSAPNTPGFTKSPMASSFPAHMHDEHEEDEMSAAEKGVQFVSKRTSFSQPQKPFQLQPPPVRIQQATPILNQDGFDPAPQPKIQEHFAAAPGEQTYDAVPIPGAYAPTPAVVTSPTYQTSFQGPPGMAMSTEGRVASPPLSPRWRGPSPAPR